MMQTLAVVALIIGVGLLLHWLGPPKRRSPEEKKSAQSPEADIPPPNTPII
jgi:hypothetical protein